MSSKNIFEVLQNIAENTESNEKFLNILKENGFTGTLEEAENQINQQAQVVLNNLTTEDLQNIAGGKSLINDKLKKALAVGGASLMAAGTVMPSSLAATKHNVKKFAGSALNYVDKNTLHKGVTSILGLTTAALLAHSIFGGKTRDVPTDEQYTESLRQKLLYLIRLNLSSNQNAYKFIAAIAEEGTKFEVTSESEEVTIQFTEINAGELDDTFKSTDDNKKIFTVKELTRILVEKLDNDNKYANSGKLTADGAKAAKFLCPIIVDQLLTNARAKAAKAAEELEEAIKQFKHNGGFPHSVEEHKVDYAQDKYSAAENRVSRLKSILTGQIEFNAES